MTDNDILKQCYSETLYQRRKCLCCLLNSSQWKFGLCTSCLDLLGEKDILGICKFYNPNHSKLSEVLTSKEAVDHVEMFYFFVNKVREIFVKKGERN